MFTRNGVRNLKEIKRGNQSKKHEQEEGMEGMDGEGSGEQSGPPQKKARQDYAVFKSDVARLQKNLDEFEQDLKEHAMQVQLKLSYILNALDESAAADAAAAHGGGGGGGGAPPSMHPLSQQQALVGR